MSENKTAPTNISPEEFLETVSENRRREALSIIAIMEQISGEKPVMWGPSIIGFGQKHYKYNTGREGDVPILAFSPRKANLTIYFDGFDKYSEMLDKLGKHKVSVGCLYINKLEDIDLDILTKMLKICYESPTESQEKITTVEQYISKIPKLSRPQFDELRQIVKTTIPEAKEVFSYGIVGYEIDGKRARVFISGWSDHVAMYPIPKNDELRTHLKPYIKGKGTLWFKLDTPLPSSLIKSVVTELTRP